MRQAKSILRECCADYWSGKGAVCSLGGVLACAICFQVLIRSIYTVDTKFEGIIYFFPFDFQIHALGKSLLLATIKSF